MKFCEFRRNSQNLIIKGEKNQYNLKNYLKYYKNEI